jgi:hypothetical protein
VPLPFTATVEVDTGVAQALSRGPYRLKVMVPVGLTPRLRVALSWMVPPTVTGAEAEVVSLGAAELTVTDSPWALHAAAAGALLTSPE